MLARDSLYARSALVLFLGILALEMALMPIGWFLVVGPLVQGSAEDFAALMVRVGQLKSGLSDQERQAFFNQLQAIHRLTVEPGGTPLTGDHSWLPYIQDLEASLVRHTGRQVEVLEQGDGYVLDLPTRAGPLRLYFQHKRIGTAPTLTFALMVLLALAASLAAALLLARSLTRPMQSFLARTEQISRGQTPDLLPETGPRELRHLAIRFNILAGQVRELMDDRTAMLAGLSHDLRAPITRARMALELARPDMETALHGQLEQALIQLEAMTRQYLDFAAGVRPNLGASVRAGDIVAELLSTIPPGRIRAELALCPTGVAETAFRRCAQNLLDNALKYGGDTVVDVCLSCDAKGSVLLEITDSGPGIPVQDQERVFRPFVRLDPSRGSPGNGLGLSVVRQICRAQGWEVELLVRPAEEGGGVLARLNVPG